MVIRTRGGVQGKVIPSELGTPHAGIFAQYHWNPLVDEFGYHFRELLIDMGLFFPRRIAIGIGRRMVAIAPAIEHLRPGFIFVLERKTERVKMDFSHLATRYRVGRHNVPMF